MQRLALCLSVAILWLAGACASAPVNTTSLRAKPLPATTMLISIDGFRADYLERGVTPNLSALAAAGARAKVMRPSFPSLTFPNHYSMVTGLRPDRHGIVNNTMEDPEVPGVTFRLSNRKAVEDRRWWEDAEPLWVTAERAGIRTATMFWPGSEAPIRGVYPADWLSFDDKLPNEARVDKVLGWLQQPAPKRPRFITLYFSEVDHAGHAWGPDDPRTDQAVANVDRAIGRLREGIEAARLDESVNIIVVSDHGMAATSDKRVVRLDELVSSDAYRLVTLGSVAGIEPIAGKEAEAEKLLGPHPHMSCWRKGQIPSRLGYGRHRRVPSIVCLAETGWLILGKESRYRMNGGAHGYDNMAPDMAALFIAQGPAFRAGVTLDEIRNVDVYPLLAKLIGVTPRQNEGEAKATRAAVRRD